MRSKSSEADLPATQQAPEARARFPGSDEVASRTRHPASAPRKGPPKANGLAWLTNPAPEARKLALPQGQRLKTKREFTGVYERGKRSGGQLVTVWALSEVPRTRVAFVASKRVGKAVIRNRAKRWMREIYRRHQLQIAGAFHLVFVARSRLPGATYAQVEAEMLHHLRRVGCMRTGRGAVRRAGNAIDRGSDA